MATTLPAAEFRARLTAVRARLADATTENGTERLTHYPRDLASTVVR